MIELIVRVVYEPERSRQLMDMEKKALALAIRRDMDYLKMPHPPEANIRKPEMSGIVFSWATTNNSVRYCCHPESHFM
jgi:hypothetical protein